MQAKIEYVGYYVPDNCLSNEDIHKKFPEWSIEKITEKVGIKNRYVTPAQQFSSDLACLAIENLFLEYPIDKNEIDYLLLCTQNPDYLTPSTSCLVQNRVGLPTTIGALDLNVGCAGYPYGLSIAQSLITSGQAKKILLVTSTTMAKCTAPEDKGLISLFGDAATVTLLQYNTEYTDPFFVFGTDGSGANDLLIENSGMHQSSNQIHLYMDGPKVFNFIVKSVPAAFNLLLERAKLSMDQIDHFVFHQANRFILEHLREILKIPKDRFLLDMENFGNTSSSSIPILLTRASASGRIKKNDRLLLMAFGGGYSWAGSIWRWR